MTDGARSDLRFRSYGGTRVHSGKAAYKHEVATACGKTLRDPVASYGRITCVRCSKSLAHERPVTCTCDGPPHALVCDLILGRG